jgi:hypothetical protein
VVGGVEDRRRRHGDGGVGSSANDARVVDERERTGHSSGGRSAAAAAGESDGVGGMGSSSPDAA